MKAHADLWKFRDWNQPGGRAAYWIRKAIAPGASEIAKGAARCFWAMALDELGEDRARHELMLAGVDLPDWLADCPPARELIKQQRARKAAA